MSGSGRPRRRASWVTPVSGERKLRSTSTASAFSGEMYSTRQRCFGSAGAGSLASLSMAHKNAARVLPDPVGAMTRVCLPWPIALQASACADVGSAKAAVNQALVAALNSASGGLWAAPAIPPSCLVLPTVWSVATCR